MRRFSLPYAVVSLCGAALLFSACGGGGDDDAGAASVPTSPAVPTQRPAIFVVVFDNTFSPGQRTVKAGDEVKWEWDGKNPHSVVGTFDGVAVDSGQKSGKETFSFKFEKAGTFEYQCGVHGAGMAGKITVQ
ncbi:MAG: plastocyanin/azurin family copper-binding protein [Dehalococcoidia bacterium]